MYRNVLLPIAGMIFGWLVIRIFINGFEIEYLVFSLFGFMVGYLAKSDKKEECAEFTVNSE